MALPDAESTPPAPRRGAFLYTDEFLSYDLGPHHPLQQRRLQMVFRMLRAYGVLSPEGGPVAWRESPSATYDEIRRVHSADFVDAVQRASRGETGGFLSRYGLVADTPAFPGMYEAAALYAGGTVEAARLVLDGAYEAAFNVAGGLHHAHPRQASGFCTFNDLAMGIHELLRGGLARVAYIDIDVHHGDGVQNCFYDDPRVMTISLHQSGRVLLNGRGFFPGTGFPFEIGEGAAFGTSLNVPLYPYTEDALWHEVFDRIVPPALARFRPEAIVLQIGADAHFADPLASLQLTSHGWMRAIEKLLGLSTGLPLVVTGGGGYNLKTVARLWTMVQAMVAGITLPDTVPEPLASELGIAHLHDDTPAPEVPAAVRDDARRYAEEQITALEALLA